MELIRAIILGIIQGATEFLPISSSGHLLIIPSLVGWSEPNLNAIAIAHLGTLVAILIYFRQDIWQIALAVLKNLRNPRETKESRLGWTIIIASIPAAIVGLLAADEIDAVLAKPNIAAGLLLVTAAVLVLGERNPTGSRALGQVTLGSAVLIGLAQVFALLPGISRSGVTISAAMGLGFDRSSSARFSFLLGTPAIAGAGALALIDLFQASDLLDQIPVLAATLTSAAVVGYACIHFLLGWLRRRGLYVFAIYCTLVAILYFGFNYLR